MTSEFCIAVHALVYLNHKQCTISSEQLAHNICTNPARIRKVMAQLKKAGLVETREGVDGGYLFTKEPQEVDLCQIGKALETRYVGTSWRSGAQDMECLVASGMAGIMDEILGELNQVCKERLSNITLDSIDKRIFGTD